MVPINTYSSACRSNFWIPSNRFILPSWAGWAPGPESQHCFCSSCNFRPRDSALGFWKMASVFCRFHCPIHSWNRGIQQQVVFDFFFHVWLWAWSKLLASVSVMMMMMTIIDVDSWWRSHTQEWGEMRAHTWGWVWVWPMAMCQLVR